MLETYKYALKSSLKPQHPIDSAFCSVVAYATIQQRHQIFSCKSIVNKAMKNCLQNAKCCIDSSVQTLFSVLSWGTFGSGCSLQSSGVWCHELCSPRFGIILTFLSADHLRLDGYSHDWCLSRAVWVGLGFWLNHSRTLTEQSWRQSCAPTVSIVLLDCKTLGTLLRSWGLYIRFSLNKFLCLAPVLLSQLQKNTPTAHPVWPLCY